MKRPVLGGIQNFAVEGARDFMLAASRAGESVMKKMRGKGVRVNTYRDMVG